MIGVIGGMGPLATVDFLTKVIEEAGADDDADHVPMLISCDPRIPKRPAAILDGGASPFPVLRQIRDRLLAGGATALVMPCNTAHYWYEELAADSPVPFLSIVEAGCDAARHVTPAGGAIAIAATRATLAARVFDTPLVRRGLIPLVPTDAELDEWLLPAIAAVKAGQLSLGGELLEGALCAFADRGVARVLLACTELPIALAATDGALSGSCIDPSRALARATVLHWRGSLRDAAGPRSG
ncbi:MAG: aspartate/glutamate racemase family protein [Burkholderiales bacterium]